MNTQFQLAAYINPEQEWFSKLSPIYEHLLIPYRKHNYWGFCAANKNIFLDSIYEEVKPFNGNIAMVKIKARWGAIDNRGKQIIPCIYEDISDSFQEELAIVKLNGKWGLINKTGELLSRCFFEKIDSFSGGFAKVKLDKMLFSYDDVVIGDSTFEHGLSLKFNKNGEYGYIDKMGRITTPCIFEEAEPFLNGIARVYVNGKWNLIDTNNTILEISDIEKTYKFIEDLAIKNKGDYPNKYGFIDKLGKEVIPCIYDTVYDFKEGVALVQLNDKWGYIDKLGNEVIPCIYEEHSYDFSEGLVTLKLKNKWGFVDQNGKTAIPFIYDGARNFSDEMAAVSLNCKWNSFWGVYGKYGFIDKSGKEVISCIYDHVYDFKEGLALVKLKGKQGYINKEGVQYWED